MVRPSPSPIRLPREQQGTIFTNLIAPVVGAGIGFAAGGPGGALTGASVGGTAGDLFAGRADAGDVGMTALQVLAQQQQAKHAATLDEQKIAQTQAQNLNATAALQAQGQQAQFPQWAVGGGVPVGGDGLQSPVAQSATRDLANVAANAQAPSQKFRTQFARQPGALAEEERDEAEETIRRAFAAARGEDVEIDPAKAQRAMAELDVSSRRQNAVLRRISPTPSDQLAMQRESTLQRAVTAAQQQLSEGATLQDLATNPDPMISLGASALQSNLGTTIRQLRNQIVYENASIRKSLRDFYMDQAQGLIENRGLQGEVSPNRVATFLRTGEGGDTQLQVAGETSTLAEELGQAQRTTRLAARAGAASDVSGLPSVQAIEQEISSVVGSLDPDEDISDLGDEEQARLNELFDKRAQIGEQRLGLDRSDPSFPFATRIEEIDEGFFGDDRTFELSATPEGRALHQFILDQGGSVSDALNRARQLRANTRPNSPDRANMEALIAELERMSEAGVDRIAAPRTQ